MIASSHNRECRHGYACPRRNECDNAYGVSGYPGTEGLRENWPEPLTGVKEIPTVCNCGLAMGSQAEIMRAMGVRKRR
jgi:hypothetical protein